MPPGGMLPAGTVVLSPATFSLQNRKTINGSFSPRGMAIRHSSNRKRIPGVTSQPSRGQLALGPAGDSGRQEACRADCPAAPREGVEPSPRS